MKVLNLLAACGTGGIEVLLRDIMLDNSFDNRICCLFEEGAIYDELKSKTDKIFSLKNKNRNKKAIVEELKNYCIKEKIDIVTIHHGGTSCNLIYIMLKKKLPNIKYVRYFHSSFDKYWDGRKGKLKDIIVKKVMEKAIQKSDLLIFISNAVKKSFEDNFNMHNKPSVVIYNGINSKFLKQNKEKLQEDDKYNLIFVGRLEKVKGVDILIRALKKVHEKYLNANLTIIGDGSERYELEELAEKIEVKEYVNFLGRQNDVIDYLDKAGIFIYPSTWEEGFGISVVQAMARRCIPVTFRKGGLPEIIKDGENGYIVDNVNDEDLAKTIEKIINLPKNKRETMINNAINTASNYTIEKTIQLVKKAYDNLM